MGREAQDVITIERKLAKQYPLPGGEYIILHCSERAFIGRVWTRGHMLVAIKQFFFPDGTVLVHRQKGTLVQVDGDKPAVMEEDGLPDIAKRRRQSMIASGLIRASGG